MFIYSSKFKKSFDKLSKKLQDKVEERLRIFAADEFSEILDNHKLHGEYTNYRSIEVTGNWRIVYRKIDASTYYLYKVGTHPQLYG